MRNPENIQALTRLPIDFIGFIFYDKSPRNVGKYSSVKTPEHIQRVGVFVNADIDFIFEKIDKYQLDLIQLHGDESPKYCQQILAKASIKIIKAFRVSDSLPIELDDYEDCCTYFLFDTKAKAYGGTGKKFNWSVLEQYRGKTPFLLSGGISESDAESVKALTFDQLAGIDINSKFEIEPALKDIAKIESFLAKE